RLPADVACPGIIEKALGTAADLHGHGSVLERYKQHHARVPRGIARTALGTDSPLAADLQRHLPHVATLNGRQGDHGDLPGAGLSHRLSEPLHARPLFRRDDVGEIVYHADRSRHLNGLEKEEKQMDHRTRKAETGSVSEV